MRRLPLIHAGDDIAALVCGKVKIEDGNILSIASTIRSKANGNTKRLPEITVSEQVVRPKEQNGNASRYMQAVLEASTDIIPELPSILSEMVFGHIGVRAGVDESNIEDGILILLPPDPIKAADELRKDIK